MSSFTATISPSISATASFISLPSSASPCRPLCASKQSSLLSHHQQHSTKLYQRNNNACSCASARTPHTLPASYRHGHTQQAQSRRLISVNSRSSSDQYDAGGAVGSSGADKSSSKKSSLPDKSSLLQLPITTSAVPNKSLRKLSSVSRENKTRKNTIKSATLAISSPASQSTSRSKSCTVSEAEASEAAEAAAEAALASADSQVFNLANIAWMMSSKMLRQHSFQQEKMERSNMKEASKLSDSLTRMNKSLIDYKSQFMREKHALQRELTQIRQTSGYSPMSVKPASNDRQLLNVHYFSEKSAAIRARFAEWRRVDRDLNKTVARSDERENYIAERQAVLIKLLTDLQLIGGGENDGEKKDNDVTGNNAASKSRMSSAGGEVLYDTAFEKTAEDDATCLYKKNECPGDTYSQCPNGQQDGQVATAMDFLRPPTSTSAENTEKSQHMSRENSQQRSMLSDAELAERFPRVFEMMMDEKRCDGIEQDNGEVRKTRSAHTKFNLNRQAGRAARSYGGEIKAITRARAVETHPELGPETDDSYSQYEIVGDESLFDDDDDDNNVANEGDGSATRKNTLVRDAQSFKNARPQTVPELLNWKTFNARKRRMTTTCKCDSMALQQQQITKETTDDDSGDLDTEETPRNEQDIQQQMQMKPSHQKIVRRMDLTNQDSSLIKNLSAAIFTRKKSVLMRPTLISRENAQERIENGVTLENTTNNANEIHGSSTSDQSEPNNLSQKIRRHLQRQKLPGLIQYSGGFILPSLAHLPKWKRELIMEAPKTLSAVSGGSRSGSGTVGKDEPLIMSRSQRINELNKLIGQNREGTINETLRDDFKRGKIMRENVRKTIRFFDNE